MFSHGCALWWKTRKRYVLFSFTQATKKRCWYCHWKFMCIIGRCDFAVCILCLDILLILFLGKCFLGTVVLLFVDILKQQGCWVMLLIDQRRLLEGTWVHWMPLRWIFLDNLHVSCTSSQLKCMLHLRPDLITDKTIYLVLPIHRTQLLADWYFGYPTIELGSHSFHYICGGSYSHQLHSIEFTMCI